MNDAFAFAAGRRLSLWIDPPVTFADIAGLEPACAECIAAVYRVEGGRLVRD